MWVDEQEDEEAGGWLRRTARIGGGVLAAIGVAAVLYTVLKDTSLPQRHAINMVTRVLLPPPPAPPPPPKPPEPEKVVEQPKIQEPKPVEKPPDKATPKPTQPPLSPLTAEAGTGSNPYGLQVGTGSGDVIGGGNAGGGGTASYISYSRVVSGQVQNALRRDDKLRFGRFAADLRVWVDTSGRVTRVQLTSSSGDAAVDGALTQALSGLSMGEPPPQGIPQPIRLRTRAVSG
jgi:TonB family protein